MPAIVEITHTYDKASNRLTRYNQTPTLAWSHRHEEFEYDGLHRLQEARRGVRDGQTFTHSSGGQKSQQWTLDMLGNWDEFKTWTPGSSSYGDVETRAHSDTNELTSRTLPGNATPLDSTYDKVGNLRTQEIRQGANTITVTYTWDAWNRLVKVEYGTSVRAAYQYNGLNWRTVKRSDTSSPPNGTLNQQRVMYYNAAWQLMEELINDSWTTSSSNNDHDRRMQYIWGLRYIDDIAVRREHEPIGTLGPGTLVGGPWYHLTDTLFSTVAILDDSAQLVERISYDAYGRARHHRMADLTGDGGVDTSDRDAMRGINWGDYGVGDLNRDGIVDSADLALLDADWGRGLGEGRISATDNIVGYAGYIFNAEMHGAGLHTVRHRNYAPDLGRWINRDPAGYADGMNVYMYVRSMPLRAIDPTGLLAELLQVGATGDNGDGDGDGDGDEGGGDDDCDDKEKCPGGKLKTTQKVVIKGQVVAQNECELCCPAGSPPRASVEIGQVKGGGSVPRGASIVEVDGDVYWYKIIASAAVCMR